MRVGVLGATGAVGREIRRLVEASTLPVDRLVPWVSARTAGTPIPFRGGKLTAVELRDDTFEAVDLLLASAGAAVARAWAPRFVAAGAVVIDNSSAFRRDPEVPLVVPEVNGDLLGAGTRLVANPNCSTIQMVAALAPLHARYGLRAVRVATYQSVSGAGGRAMTELEEGTRARLAGEAAPPAIFPHPIPFNLIPQIGPPEEGGEYLEERKMRDETRRILGLPALPVSAHCVRVPVFRGHSEVVWAGFDTEPAVEEARRLLRDAGLTVEDDPARSIYPTPLGAAERDDVFVGRVRNDPVDPRGLVLWVVSDNLLKGAALNAVQIALHLAARGHLPRREAS